LTSSSSSSTSSESINVNPQTEVSSTNSSACISSSNASSYDVSSSSSASSSFFGPIQPWKDPLFVIWVPPLLNSSLEQNWLDDWVLAKVDRPVIRVYPEVCHLDLVYNGKHIPKYVAYVVGAARAPDWLHDCFERVKKLKSSKNSMSESDNNNNNNNNNDNNNNNNNNNNSSGNDNNKLARVGMFHLSDEYIGYGDICKPDDHIGHPISFQRCDS
jgi:hypothetical protein